MLVFIKAVKSLAFSISLFPITGCAIALGLIFSGLLKAEAYAPDLSISLFNKAMLGFALVELYLIVILVIIGLIFVF